MTQPNAEKRLSKLLVTNKLTPESLLDDLREIYDEVWYCPRMPFTTPIDEGPQPTAEQLANAEALVTFQLPAALKSVSDAPNLKFIQVLSAGINQIERTQFWQDLPAENDLMISNASGIHVVTIAEHVLTTVQMLLHKLAYAVLVQRTEQRWAAHTEFGGHSLTELRGLTFGVLGYGHIGRECARLAHAHGATVFAATRDGQRKPSSGYLVPGTGDHTGSLPEQWFATQDQDAYYDFLGRCDIVVNTLPLANATAHMVDEAALSAMKGSAIYCNIGRGGTTDGEAILKALQAGNDFKGSEEERVATGSLRIGGASLDVTEPEPLPQGHPLFSLPNAIITPHMCGLSKLYFVRAMDLLKTNTERINMGFGPLNSVRGKGENDRL